MNQNIRVPIQKLPEAFRKEIHDHIRLYSVTMLMAEGIENDDVLSCSGTLCSFDSKFGIVTARHVWEEARKYKMLIVMTSRGPYQLKTQNIVPSIPQPKAIFTNTDAKIPDIAFLYLDAKQKDEIESFGKVFYSLEKRINSPYLNVRSNDGYWAVFGNPGKLLKTEERIVPSFIYGTGVRDYVEIDGWDYLVADLNIPENPEIPRDFGGVSGGGVWRTMWCSDSEQTRFVVPNLIEDCVFVGVSFYQTGGKENQLIMHGPNSIYNRLLDFI